MIMYKLESAEKSTAVELAHFTVYGLVFCIPH